MDHVSLNCVIQPKNTISKTMQKVAKEKKNIKDIIDLQVWNIKQPKS